MKVRLAVISATGTARKRTIPALQDSTSVQVVAVHGRDGAKVDALADEFGIERRYTDVDALLRDGEIDMVFIGSPPFLHEEQVGTVVASGIPTMCEKPLANDLRAAEKIAVRVEQSGTPFALAHHLRHQPLVHRVKELIDRGTLGPPRRADLQWSFALKHDSPNARWKLDPDLGGRNAFFDAGVHALDLAIHLFGGPQSVVAHGFSTAAPRTDDNLVAMLMYPQLTVTLSASQVMRFPANDLRVDFESGHLVAPAALNEASASVLHVTDADGARDETFPVTNPYATEVEDFAAELRGAGDGRCTTIDQALLASRILDAIAVSAASGCAERVS